MRRLTVLLIAHNLQEVRLTQQTFAQAGPRHTLRVVRDGEEALAYLLQEGPYADSYRAPRPDVIVLDLPLPRLSGDVIVQRLKQDQRFKRMPIIVLAPSGRAEDVCQAYAAGANAYLRKPVEMARFLDVMAQLKKFWLETVELPPDA
jgi:CheY-like chemotaxis protein